MCVCAFECRSEMFYPSHIKYNLSDDEDEYSDLSIGSSSSNDNDDDDDELSSLEGEKKEKNNQGLKLTKEEKIKKNILAQEKDVTLMIEKMKIDLLNEKMDIEEKQCDNNDDDKTMIDYLEKFKMLCLNIGEQGRHLLYESRDYREGQYEFENMVVQLFNNKSKKYIVKFYTHPKNIEYDELYYDNHFNTMSFIKYSYLVLGLHPEYCAQHNHSMDEMKKDVEAFSNSIWLHTMKRRGFSHVKIHPVTFEHCNNNDKENEINWIIIKQDKTSKQYDEKEGSENVFVNVVEDIEEQSPISFFVGNNNNDDDDMTFTPNPFIRLFRCVLHYSGRQVTPSYYNTLSRKELIQFKKQDNERYLKTKTNLDRTSIFMKNLCLGSTTTITTTTESGEPEVKKMKTMNDFFKKTPPISTTTTTNTKSLFDHAQHVSVTNATTTTTTTLKKTKTPNSSLKKRPIKFNTQHFKQSNKIIEDKLKSKISSMKTSLEILSTDFFDFSIPLDKKETTNIVLFDDSETMITSMDLSFISMITEDNFYICQCQMKDETQNNNYFITGEQLKNEHLFLIILFTMEYYFKSCTITLSIEDWNKRLHQFEEYFLLI